MNRMKFETGDLVEKNVERIGALFPNCVTEMLDEEHSTKEHKVYKKAINFELLKQMLSGEVVDGDEAYEFTWVGKKAAIVEANKPIRKTLRPCPEESKNWDATENLYIEGDNLEVLKLLQESYLGKVKMIYIDPPYNTGNDFIYADDFRMKSEEWSVESGAVDEEGDRLFRNTDTNGRFHSDWCSMIYSRLMLARNLLTDDGVIFISIDDNEQSNLKKICDEVFGASCFVCSAIWRSSDNSNNDAKQFSNDHNYTLIYSKAPLWQPQKQYDENKRKHFKNPDNDPKGAWFDGNPLNSPNYRENLCYTITAPNGYIINPPKNGWRWSKETLEEKMATGEIYFNADQTNIKRRTYLCDVEGLPPSTLWIDLDTTGHNRQAKYELLSLMPENVFDTPKPTKLLKYIIALVRDAKDAIVMDFFSGSGTTADAVMQLNAEDGGNRKYILIQLPENLDESYAKAANDKKMVLKNAIDLCDKNKVPHVLSEVAKERIRRAGAQICKELEEHGYALKKLKTEGKPYTIASRKQKSLFDDEDYISNPEIVTGITTEPYEVPENIDEIQRNMASSLDAGFRVLKLDDSNMKDVYYAPDTYNQGMLASLESNIKKGRTDLDLLFGCLLDWGLPLSLPYTSEEIEGCTVHTYNDGDLIACFNDNIPESVIKEIAKRKPLRAVFRDSSFASSPAKINVFEIFKLYMPEDANDIGKRVRVI